MGKVPVCIHTWIEPQGEQYLYPPEISADQIITINNALATCSNNPILLSYQVESVQTGNMPYLFDGQELYVYWIVSAGGIEIHGRPFNTVKMALLPYKQNQQKETEIFQSLQELSIPDDVAQLYLPIYIPEQIKPLDTIEKNNIEKEKTEGKSTTQSYSKKIYFLAMACMVVLSIVVMNASIVKKQDKPKPGEPDAKKLVQPVVKNPEEPTGPKLGQAQLEPKDKFDITKFPDLVEKTIQKFIEENQFISFKTFIKSFPGIYDKEDFKGFFEINSEEEYKDQISKFLEKENIPNSKIQIEARDPKGEILLPIYLGYLDYWLGVAERIFFQKEEKFLEEKENLENAITLHQKISEMFKEFESSKKYLQKISEKIENLKSKKEKIYNDSNDICKKRLKDYENLKDKLNKWEKNIESKRDREFQENKLFFEDIKNISNSLNKYKDYAEEKVKIREILQKIERWKQREKDKIEIRITILIPGFNLKIEQEKNKFKINKIEINPDYTKTASNDKNPKIEEIYIFSIELDSNIICLLDHDTITFKLPSSIEAIKVSLLKMEEKKKEFVIPRIVLLTLEASIQIGTDSIADKGTIFIK